ncbi:MAG: YdcF family protein [Proteobacteria bacterium]|nr:YdcF family protein [Pseudomonadota bacterium]
MSIILGWVSLPTNALIALALLGLALRALRWRRSATAALGLALVLFFGIGCGPITVWLLQGLQAPFAQRAAIDWAPRNVIVLLGAGTVRTAQGVEPALFANGRINEALALYRQCKAADRECKLEVSGGDAMNTGEPEATVYATLLQDLGVPASDLLLESRSMNTWQNARFSVPVLSDYGAQKVVLVSSATHLRRASLYFSHFGIHATPVRGDWLRAQMAWWPQAWNFALADVAMHEYAGVWRYRLYNAMGWNVRASKPGAA